MEIDYKTVSPLELTLDYENPRFLKELRNEDEVRSYLIEYEDSLSVAYSLKESGLLPGDMVICVHEGRQLIVMEGNRRISIMQMLLDRGLIPEKHIADVPRVSDEVLDEIRSLTVQVIKTREEAMLVMANRHITGIRQWKPLAKMKFFASRFDSGMSIEQLSNITNISKGDISRFITDYKFFNRNYELYKKENPSFEMDLSDIPISRFLRIFTVKTFTNEGDISGASYLMMYENEKLEYESRLPDELFTEFTQHIFSKAFDGEKNDSINTRSTFDDIPDAKLWKSRIDESRADVHKRLAERGPLTHEDGDKLPIEPEKSEGDIPTDKEGDKLPVEPERPRTGGPTPPTFMGNLYWGDMPKDDNDSIAFIRTIKELYDLSRGSRGKGYVLYPTSAGMLLRSAYEQGLKTLLKKVDLWDEFTNSKPNPRDQTISAMEAFVANNQTTCLGVNNAFRSSFNHLQRGDYRKLLNDYTHDLDYLYATKYSLEGIAGGGMHGFLQGVINKISETSKRNE